jgi:hypothetical protein
VRSLLNEAVRLCTENNEPAKYLMTFQNLLSRVPKWNANIVEEERARIVEKSGCAYLEDLLTCVHIIQLKVLTCIRVGNRQKKIDIAIPKLDAFLHKVYIHVARKMYQNVYLFDKVVAPLQLQKNGREVEIIIKECILSTIRDSIPTESIIRAYLDEGLEHEEEVTVETVDDAADALASPKHEPGSPKSAPGFGFGGASSDPYASDMADLSKPSEEIEEPPLPPEEPIPVVPTIRNIDAEPVTTRLSFNDYDSVLAADDSVESVAAPKNLDRLEEISTSRALQRKLEEEEDFASDRIRIHTDNLGLDEIDLF